VFVGIRNGVTSVQGLVSLLNAGVTLFVVDTAKHAVVFHPKVYAAWNINRARIIVGSANLTFPGLHNSIEASADIRLDLGCPEDKKALEKFTKLMLGFPTKHPDNVFRLNSVRDAVSLLREGRVEDERVSRKPSLVTRRGTVESKRTPSIGLPYVRPPRKAGTRKQIRGLTRGKATKASSALSMPLGPFLWEKIELSLRDIQLPRPPTKPTGHISLTQARFRVGSNYIDKTSYFRQTAFAGCGWVTDPKDPAKETASAKFVLIVAGLDYGTFTLKLSHKPEWESGQGNYTTAIHWGKAKPVIQDENLLGRNLKLYGPIKRGEPYTIVID
jgi:hypothetical protein